MPTSITLTEAQLAVISEALAELPFKKAAPVLAALQLQVRTAAIKAAEAAKAAGETKPAEAEKPTPVEKVEKVETVKGK